mmetsp:Transcript_18070/g.15061  ORF Transcript_18070/g.15061 Transcript_18070/m.15061 type:complete len:88 (-) Transcript_18070:22-285(-)
MLEITVVCSGQPPHESPQLEVSSTNPHFVLMGSWKDRNNYFKQMRSQCNLTNTHDAHFFFYDKHNDAVKTRFQKQSSVMKPGQCPDN